MSPGNHSYTEMKAHAENEVRPYIREATSKAQDASGKKLKFVSACFQKDQHGQILGMGLLDFGLGHLDPS